MTNGAKCKSTNQGNTQDREGLKINSFNPGEQNSQLDDTRKNDKSQHDSKLVLPGDQNQGNDQDGE